ncbi:hypothetical protein DXX99_07905 [Ammonifex thiophilus]|uniref:Uncharacterized protein n=1 Tax=Ammonifex thiophilus TaxID=444093 RepID=A0A3D8P2C5_9THEO|nr:hypothetical protein DXX99_07905 [Ammonifex thiophilus]
MKGHLVRDPEFAKEYEALEREFRRLAESIRQCLKEEPSEEEAEELYLTALAARRLAGQLGAPEGRLLSTGEVASRLGLGRKRSER